MKILDKAIIKASDITAEMDIREAALNPNIVKFFQIFDKPRDLILEFMARGDMVNLIEVCGCMREEKVWPIVHQVASAVQYLHERNIAHCDINIVH